MLFNSYSFVLLFLPLVVAAWWYLPCGHRGRLLLLVTASYVFYGLWDWRFLSLLAVSTVLDFYVGGQLYKSRKPASRTAWLCVSVCTNLGILGVFKYSGMLAETLNALGRWADVGGNLPVPALVLPVGISFYTFQTMSYAIDLYRGQAQPAKSLLHFAAYVSMFPQLVAGPIVRYSDIDEQLRVIPFRPKAEQFASGIMFFVAGMIQKVLLADPIARRIDPLLADVDSLQFATAWFAILGYALQLYFDFAGYSNMAVGLGRMLGFEFCQNFDSPYQSSSIQSFWRRWHISLSTLLRDYLFVPLGGSRHGAVLTIRNLMIVMLLGGLWHGAGWTFVLWGLYHGLLLTFHAVWKKLAICELPRAVGQLITFVAVLFGWVLFRLPTVSDAFTVYRAMLGQSGWGSSPLSEIGGYSSAILILVLLGIALLAPNLWKLRWKASPAMGALAACALLLCVLRFDVVSPFLYFQF